MNGRTWSALCCIAAVLLSAGCQSLGYERPSLRRAIALAKQPTLTPVKLFTCNEPAISHAPDGNSTDIFSANSDTNHDAVDSNQKPYMPQVSMRLGHILIEEKYVYLAGDHRAWRRLLDDEGASVYARLCAAYLLEQAGDHQGREFIIKTAHSKNVRHRYNAVWVTIRCLPRTLLGSREWWLLYQESRPSLSWIVDLWTDLLATGEIDPTSESAPEQRSHLLPEFPEGDQVDVEINPEWVILEILACVQERRAVPAMITAFRRTAIGAPALANMGDRRTIPVLMETLVGENGELNYDQLRALAKFKHAEAVPLILEHMGNDSFAVWALGEIGDARGIPAIEKYLEEKPDERGRRAAFIALAQLQSKSQAELADRLLARVRAGDVWGELIDALGECQDERVVPELIKLTQQGLDPGPLDLFRIYSIDALGTHGGEEAVRGLISMFDWDWSKVVGGKDEDSTVENHRWIACALVRATGETFGMDVKKWKEWAAKPGPMQLHPEKDTE